MKKSYYLFLLLLVAATSFSVHAQTGQKFPDFKLGASSKLQTNGMQKVSPNEEKEIRNPDVCNNIGRLLQSRAWMV